MRRNGGFRGRVLDGRHPPASKLVRLAGKSPLKNIEDTSFMVVFPSQSCSFFGGVSNLTTIVSPNLLTDYKTGVLFHQADQAYRLEMPPSPRLAGSIGTCFFHGWKW